MILHVLEQLADHARNRADHPALVQATPLCDGPRRLTYGQLHGAVDAMARRLAARTQPGDVAMLCSSNRPEYVIGYLAALAANLTVFPVYPSLTDSELRDAAKRSGARAFIGTNDRFATLRESDMAFIDLLDAKNGANTLSESASNTNRLTDRAAMLLQSSGTTGLPKIVRRSGASLDAVARNVVDAIGLNAADRVLAAIPLCHSYGVENGLLGPLLAGCTVHLCDGIDTRIIAMEIAREAVTVLPGTPFMFEMLAQTLDAAASQSLRAPYSAGAPLPEPVASAFRLRTGVSIGQLYGSTEVGSVTYNDPTCDQYEPGSVGRAMTGVEIRVLDASDPRVDRPLPVGSEGYVAIAAPSMLEGYVDDPSPALVDGFFLTGDLGCISAPGNLTITGRVKLQINIGGLKVNPLEIEKVMMSHPHVAECVVVPVAVTATLDRLCAIIVPSDPDRPPSGEDLRQFARDRLSRHKVPRIFQMRDSLPKTPSGKILRGAVQCH